MSIINNQLNVDLIMSLSLLQMWGWWAQDQPDRQHKLLSEQIRQLSVYDGITAIAIKKNKN